MTAVEIRPATAEDVRSFYGAPEGQTVRALVAVLDGEIVGIGGLRYQGDSVVAFSKLAPAIRSRRKDIVRGARAVMQMIERRGKPVMAAAEPTEPNAPSFLARLGFEQVATVEGMEVFRWLNSQSR